MLKTFLLFICLVPSWALGVCQQRPPTKEEFALIPNTSLGCFVDQERFYIHGEIKNEHLAELQSALAANPHLKEVVLNSPGGEYQVGLMLGDLITKAGLNTRVPFETSYCYSSCTYLFQSGTQRIAHSRSHFGYHGIIVGGPILSMIFQGQCPGPVYTSQCQKDLDELTQASLNSASEVFGNLEKKGASKELYALYMSQPEDPNWLKNGEFSKKMPLKKRGSELLNFNVVTETDDQFQLQSEKNEP